MQAVQDITSKRRTSYFNIANTKGKLCKFCLFKTDYRLGEDIVASLDFTIGTVECVQYSVRYNFVHYCTILYTQFYLFFVVVVNLLLSKHLDFQKLQCWSLYWSKKFQLKSIEFGAKFYKWWGKIFNFVFYLKNGWCLSRVTQKYLFFKKILSFSAPNSTLKF